MKYYKLKNTSLIYDDVISICSTYVTAVFFITLSDEATSMDHIKLAYEIEFQESLKGPLKSTHTIINWIDSFYCGRFWTRSYWKNMLHNCYRHKALCNYKIIK
jgi:hypothetical protein